MTKQLYTLTLRRGRLEGEIDLLHVRHAHRNSPVYRDMVAALQGQLAAVDREIEAIKSGKKSTIS